MVTGNASQQIKIIEVGPRDGLQRETVIPTEAKIALINLLSESGIKSIQITSFVHPKLVPQMADAAQVCAGIQRHPDVTYSALALNVKGVERAHDAGIEHIDISISASDTHSRQNANKSVEDAKVEFKKMLNTARSFGMAVRGGIQCAFNHHANDVTPEIVIELTKEFLDLDVDMLSLSDTAGIANPRQITELLNAINPLLEDTPLVLHLHDTQGMGLANLAAAVATGCRYFDTAFGGLGGCNFIPEALGNIATEDTINMLHAMGYSTGVDLQKVALASKHLASILSMSLPGKMYKLI